MTYQIFKPRVFIDFFSQTDGSIIEKVVGQKKRSAISNGMVKL
jgi:hypothetical protein